MAFERIRDRKILAINLNSFISSQLTLVRTLMTRRNLEDESRFNAAVLEDNLTLDQQLEYRQDQLVRAGRDRDEKRRIRDEIAGLRDRIEYKKFEDDYIAEVMKLNEGMQSVENTINWINKRMARTTDQRIIKQMNTELSALKTRRYTEQQNMLTRQTEFATNNKTVSVLDEQIGRVNNARVKALTAGNDDYVALLDLQIQALNKARTESEISSSILAYSVSTATGQSSLLMLNNLNKNIEDADPDMPINIGGTRYDSARQFWELQRSEYMNDRTQNGFFGRYSQELSDKVEYRSTRGILTNETLGDVKNWYEHIKDRPEMVDYQDQITQTQQKSMKATADLRSTAILNEFTLKQDVNKSLLELAYIQDTYGVDQTLNNQKLQLEAGAENQKQVESILSTMGQLIQQYPGISRTDAMKQAISMGAGAQVSPEEFATQKPSDIISGLGEKAEADQFGEGGKMIVSPETAGKFPQYKEGGLYKTPESNTVYKYEAGKLRGLSGQWDEAILKQATGKGFSAVEEVKNITGVPMGEEIKAVDVKPPELAGDERIKSVFGTSWKPSDIFKQRGLIAKGVSGAVRVKGRNTVWTIGNQTSALNAQQYKDMFGTESQEGIVGEISEEQAKKLGIKY